MKNQSKKTVLSLGVLLLAGIAPLPAQNQVQLVGQNNVQQSAVPATLQITGTAQVFSLVVGRADVQDVLKLVFDQGQKQFTLDAGITGQITLRLVNQPLKTVLDSICRQTFLKYQMQNGVFVFSRDEDAVRRAILQVRALNTQLRDQLRLMGLDVPPEANFYAQNGVRGGNAQGSFGGGAFSNPAGGNYNFRRLQTPPGMTAQDLLNLQKKAGQQRGQMGRNGGVTAKKADPPVSQGGRDNAKPDAATQREGETPNALGNLSDAPANSLAPNEAYTRFFQENGLYAVNTQQAHVPVIDILTELGRQSGVTVLLDPELPKDGRFRMKGKTPPRTFEETLNLIALSSRLEWRRAGNTVIISPTPEFELFFGAEAQPRLVYPNVQSVTRSKQQEAADSKDVKQDSSKKPAPEKPKETPEKGKGKEPR